MTPSPSLAHDRILDADAAVSDVGLPTYTELFMELRQVRAALKGEPFATQVRCGAGTTDALIAKYDREIAQSVARGPVPAR